MHLEIIRRENSVVLYLSGIMKNDMEDKEVVEAVKDYANECDIRIVTADVVHNRYCDYIVGVKIRVPASHVDLALEFDTWPDDIKCRKWERNRLGKYPNRGYGKDF